MVSLLRIATRRSALARAQAAQTARLITARTGAEVDLVPMATTGDLSPERAIGAFDAKGLFVDTIRQALLAGEVDLAVHSYKDLPSDPVPGLVVGAVPPREDPRDALVTRDGRSLATLGATATVGTSSERRRAQLLRANPGLEVRAVRGNLDTRLRRVADGELDAVVVAVAGLRRLYAAREAGGAGALDLPVVVAPLEPEEVLPAPAQGALAVECRADDTAARERCRAIEDEATSRAVRAERAFLSRLGGGCLAPIGALATPAGPAALRLRGLLADPAQGRVVAVSATGSPDRPEELGAALAEEALSSGGEAILAVIAATRASAPETHP